MRYLGIQQIEYPDSPNHFSEVQSTNQLPEVLNMPMPGRGIAYASGLSEQHLYQQRRNPFDLSPFASGVLISLVTALIIGAALGGGLGAALSKKRECGTSAVSSTGGLETQAPTPTQTPTPSSPTSSTLFDYAAPEPSLVETLFVDCPRLDGTILEDTASNQYTVQCESRIVGGGDVLTWSAVTAYSLQDCVQACYLFNMWETQVLCTGVSWCKSLSYCSGMNSGANCWLFNASSTIEIESNSTVAILNNTQAADASLSFFSLLPSAA
ncbi:hypothetical protein F5Y13DRAFT_168312 [Hypoxylon sp. FL1857]|nr:hypothetical protein F5Y13DRAFT_168312 [Hypoxylon sp. FL1857]